CCGRERRAWPAARNPRARSGTGSATGTTPSRRCRFTFGRLRLAPVGDSAARGGELEWMARLSPRFEPTVEGDGARAAHRAQGGGGEGRDLGQLAAREDACGRVRQVPVDARSSSPRGRWRAPVT